ncbi:MAG: hypothetical protein K8I00_06380, partial [Candidatus Omnitrophica bacterium]|nr:hypothetical protein [Candidatus Omnitrophota bacterium]
FMKALKIRMRGYDFDLTYPNKQGHWEERLYNPDKPIADYADGSYRDPADGRSQEWVVDELGRVEITMGKKLDDGDKALLSSLPVDDNPQDVGGIDMNAIHVDRQGPGISIHHNEEIMRTYSNMNIDGFVPHIINIVPVPSVLPLLGVDVDAETSLRLSQR